VTEHPGANGLSRHHPGAEFPHHGPGPMAAIGGGGALGTLARYGVERAVATDTLGFPWATFAVNVAGSFILAVVVTLVAGRLPEDRWLRPFMTVGFCGGFTTFSTFALEIDQRARHGHLGSAFVYLMASLAAGIGAALVGSALVGRRPYGGPEVYYLTDPDLLAGDDPPDRRGGLEGPR
jgi:CrcB protein